jgi:hypothetical protein
LAPIILPFDFAFVDRNENAVSSLLKGRPACCDRIPCGIALNQGPAASWLDGPELEFSGNSNLEHSRQYAPALDVRINTTEVLLVHKPAARRPLLNPIRASPASRGFNSRALRIAQAFAIEAVATACQRCPPAAERPASAGAHLEDNLPEARGKPRRQHSRGLDLKRDKQPWKIFIETPAARARCVQVESPGRIVPPATSNTRAREWTRWTATRPAFPG